MTRFASDFLWSCTYLRWFVWKNGEFSFWKVLGPPRCEASFRISKPRQVKSVKSKLRDSSFIQLVYSHCKHVINMAGFNINIANMDKTWQVTSTTHVFTCKELCDENHGPTWCRDVVLPSTRLLLCSIVSGAQCCFCWFWLEWACCGSPKTQSSMWIHWSILDRDLDMTRKLTLPKWRIGIPYYTY